jgi:hypothetical protein
VKNNNHAPATGRRAAHPALALPFPRSRVGKTVEHQTISRWTVVGNDRLMGRIHHRPGTPNGRTIMTSPVVEVRFMGVDGTLVAFTQSGNAYWLGLPADNFGAQRAQTFVWHKAQVGEAPARQPVPAGSETTVLRLLD